MEFLRKEINTSILIASKSTQLTMDDDFNIPDVKDDIDKIVSKNGYIVIEEVEAEEGKVRVAGVVYFSALYKTVGEASDLEVYAGEIPFEESVGVEGVNKDCQAECQCNLEDLTVTMINSRKLEVRGLLGMAISVYHEQNVNGAFDLENGQGIECLYKNATITKPLVSKHDMFKLKEEVEIPQNKPNIKEILWSSVELKNVDVRPLEEKLSIRGEVEIFVIYKGQEEHLPVQYLFSARTLTKEIECHDSVEGLISEIYCTLGKGDVSVRGDKDNEERIIGVDYNVDMNIKMYEDTNIKILSDLYSPQVDIKTKTECVTYDNLLMRNMAKAKINFRKNINDDIKVLQICHIYGNVEIDDVNVKDNSVEISGLVKTSILYVPSGDDPINCMEVDIPFEYTADTVPLSKEDSVRIVPCVDQLTASLVNSEEMEIRGQVNLGISIFARNTMDVITDMQVDPIDCEKKAAVPGIVGYIVKPGDTLWSVARKYYATTDSIKQINNLESDYIKEGDKLIIVKS